MHALYHYVRCAIGTNIIKEHIWTVTNINNKSITFSCTDKALIETTGLSLEEMC